MQFQDLSAIIQDAQAGLYWDFALLSGTDCIAGAACGAQDRQEVVPAGQLPDLLHVLIREVTNLHWWQWRLCSAVLRTKMPLQEPCHTTQINESSLRERF